MHQIGQLTTFKTSNQCQHLHTINHESDLDALHGVVDWVVL